MSEIILSKENFEKEVIKSELPVLVDFWATWCGPCRMLAPELEALAKEYDGKVKVAKLNVDDELDIALKYKIDVIPQVFLFKNGEVVAKFVGYGKKEELVEKLGL